MENNGQAIKKQNCLFPQDTYPSQPRYHVQHTNTVVIRNLLLSLDKNLNL